MIFGGHRNVALVEALDRSMAVIELGLDGTILTANANFLAAVGYELAEIVGRHHRVFVDPAAQAEGEYSAFWAALARGEFQRGEFKRIAKGGREFWLQASYNPVLDRGGRPIKVVKVATNITEQVCRTLDFQGKIEAIDRSRGIIEFSLDGTILTANANFLDTVGYTLAEVQGRHHAMFVDPAEHTGAAYRAFWAALGRGEYQSAEFKRLTKSGREIWLQAIYNPILDHDGKPYKVVKFASDITAEKLRMADVTGQIAAINRSQGVILFALDGTVLDANENFQSAVYYKLDEIRGRHHRMFVEPDEAGSAEYQEFWDRLRAGEYRTDVFKRVGKGGRTVWIQASYNPIFDMDGKPFKVVKYATDITGKMAAQISAANASGLTRNSVQVAAASAEELNASIGEIAQRLVSSQAEVDAIHLRAQAADGATAELSAATASMNGVVQLIQGVGEQINLLALNATIEAARAGEAGRGFAVVAGEVKSLSAQVTRATGQISHDIQAMQDTSRAVAGSLSSIAQALTSVRESVTGAAFSVNAQSAVTSAISVSMQTASQGVSEINRSLHALSS